MNNLLIIEDCPFTCQGYKTLLEHGMATPFSLQFANTCDEAVKLIKTKTFDFVLLDLQLPVSKNEKYVCGEDLGLLIRNMWPEAKIIILTNISDAIRIKSIIDEIDPEGFLIKAKSNPMDLKNTIETVLRGDRFYCNTTTNYIKENYNSVKISEYDRQILYHLSMGLKTKDLCKHIPLSLRSIEVRKTRLKTLLNSGKNKNFNLVKEAKKLGYI
ncbi:response regulator transcription factor [Hyunsoonleella sp. SJ7]|uniref:Response regulator transcription factor n=1 Tax=Hyunsoonleella aquatilis TaxID=2762758 RepID=A0A923KJZ2_9FLAO|nr:response regulator [Hyunsoonleella aquatilis]MBC3757253.1 response regulator transcription factor [Hyunsoonleella aquatilis]